MIALVALSKSAHVVRKADGVLSGKGSRSRRQGIGRSALVVACVLAVLGEKPNEALAGWA